MFESGDQIMGSIIQYGRPNRSNLKVRRINKSGVHYIEVEEVELLGGVGGEHLGAICAVRQAGDAMGVAFQQWRRESTHHPCQGAAPGVVTW